MPRQLWCEEEAHRESNSVDFRESGMRLTLTDFQVRFWNTLIEGDATIVVAPTSAGKSFALQHFVATQAFSREGCTVYIVPTRALITQVSAALESIAKRIGLGSEAIVSIPIAPDKVGMERLIYVLTQERLQILIDSAPNVKFGLIVVDEAHVISEQDRGVLLQTVVENALSLAPDAQLLFGSPLASNPNVFKDVFDLKKLIEVTEEEASVDQHLIYVEREVGRDKAVNVSTIVDGEKQEIGVVQLDEGLFDSIQTLSYLSWHFGRGTQSLVYAGGPARCEDVARMIADLEAGVELDSRAEPSPALLDFANFLREHIHPKFLLASVVEQGVAFHYGNMPSVVRVGVEEMFSDLELQFLVCTSTLLHGVNLPAKNLFLLNPTKGLEKPITSADFWNLAGRAGRMGKEFEGFIYLLDHSQWEEDPVEGQRTTPVKPAFLTTLTERHEELVDFMLDVARPSGEEQALENAFGKLFSEFKGGEVSRTLEKLPDTVDHAARAPNR